MYLLNLNLGTKWKGREEPALLFGRLYLQGESSTLTAVQSHRHYKGTLFVCALFFINHYYFCRGNAVKGFLGLYLA
jgi:hypothetical protein